MPRQLASLSLVALLFAGTASLVQAQPAPAKAPAVSKFLSPGDLDPATLLPPPPKDDAPAAVEGRAELHLEGQTVMLEPGDSWVVPKGANHTYRILDTFTAVEATCPPSLVKGRDRA